MKKFTLAFLLLLIFSKFNFSWSQAPIYQNLVLEGGGIRGIAYGGALAELNKRGVLAGLNRVGGTSAGAIQAAFLAVGYSPQEITDITFKTPIQQFSDGRFFFIGGIPRVANQFGWYRGEKFRKWLAYHIGQKTGNPNLTLAQLHAMAGHDNYLDLYVMGTSLSRQKPVVFSYKTYPNMKISDAVRISMSVPLFFRAVFMDPEGNLVKKPGRRTDIEVMVDGGILANYPIDLFDSPEYLLNPASDSSYYNSATLGIRLDTDAQIEYDQEQAGLAPVQIKKMSHYMRAFYGIIIEQLNRQQLQPDDWNRTISVSTKGYGERIRRLTEKDKAILLESGRQGVITFFDKQARRP